MNPPVKTHIVCPRCDYSWSPRMLAPKLCPRCKTRIDYGKWKVTP